MVNVVAEMLRTYTANRAHAWLLITLVLSCGCSDGCPCLSSERYAASVDSEMPCIPPEVSIGTEDLSKGEHHKGSVPRGEESAVDIASQVSPDITAVSFAGIWDFGRLRLVQHSRGGVEHRVFIQWMKESRMSQMDLVDQAEFKIPVNSFLSSGYSSGNSVSEVGKLYVIVDNIEFADESLRSCEYLLDLNEPGVIRQIERKCDHE